MKDTFSIYDTRLSYTNNTDRGIPSSGWLRKKFLHYGYFYRILHRLEYEGFVIEKDPDTLKRYPSISKDHWYGRKGDLELYARKFPNGFEMEFFQNVVHKNPHGGRYDFDKLEKMPHLLRLQYQKYMGLAVRLLKVLVDVEDITKPIGRTAEDKIYIDLAHSFTLLPKGTKIHDLDGTNPGEGYGWGHTGQMKDRDGKVIKNGDIKYFRHWWSGYLMRGRVYYRANQQFWAITDSTNIELVQSPNALFDATPEDLAARRKAPDRTPKEYRKRRQAIENIKTKELIAELRRRGI